MAYGTTTVSTTATLIIGANANRKELIIVNFSNSIIVYLGMDSSVTYSTGLPLYENQTRERGKGPDSTWLGPVYGITSSSTADVRYWEVSGR